MRKALPTPLLAVVLVVALLGSGLVRGYITHRRSGAVSTDTLARLDSFALGLLLGGFRGPLVMMLWNSTENQKSARNLEDFDTKLELIRLLQPQFDSVHIYQIWNKAYNESAEVASLPTKYAIILDALDYAHNVDAERRPDIDIKEAIGQIYFQKLGLSREAGYYDRRLRNETQADEPLVRITFPTDRLAELKEIARADGVSGIKLVVRSLPDDQSSATVRESMAGEIRKQFTGDDVTMEPREMRQIDRHPVLLDADGNLLPRNQLPRGIDLPHLRQFSPFPYGVNTHAIAYDYFKQALTLQTDQHQKHIQLSERVISSRPALAMREWTENVFDAGRLAELEWMGAAEPLTSNDFENNTAELAPTPMASTALFDEALWDYRRTVQLVDATDAEFAAHLDRFPNDQVLAIYRDDRFWLQALKRYVLADIDYLRLTQASDPSERQRLAASARQKYETAAVELARYVTRYHTSPDIVRAVGLQPGRFEAADIPSAMALDAARRGAIAADQNPYGYDFTQEAEEFDAYLKRIARRVQLLTAMTSDGE